MDFSFWGFLTDIVYIYAFQWIFKILVTKFVMKCYRLALVEVDFLNKLWDELNYRPDICRITTGSSVENFKNTWKC
jgi:hypothetical protein